jgi:hypothetical protein
MKPVIVENFDEQRVVVNSALPRDARSASLAPWEEDQRYSVPMVGAWMRLLNRLQRKSLAASAKVRWVMFSLLLVLVLLLGYHLNSPSISVLEGSLLTNSNNLSSSPSLSSITFTWSLAIFSRMA